MDSKKGSSASNVGPVTEVIDDDDFQAKKLAAGDRLIVVDFHAVWCGPCKMIAPKFNQLSLSFPEVVFLKVDVDKCAETAADYGVSAMPTFIFLHNGKVLAKIQGADANALESKLTQCSQMVGGLESAESDSNIPAGMMDLEQFTMEKNCLNENEDHPLSYALQANKDLYLESDCDPELLVSMSFNQMVKLHSMVCQGPADGHAPKTIKLYINQPNGMDFDSARDGKPLQEITLTAEEVSEGNVIKLKFVKLQNVNNITLFFPDNQGDEETTRITRLIFYGKPVSTTNMSDFKRVTGKKGEAH